MPDDILDDDGDDNAQREEPQGWDADMTENELLQEKDWERRALLEYERSKKRSGPGVKSLFIRLSKCNKGQTQPSDACLLMVLHLSHFRRLRRWASSSSSSCMTLCATAISKCLLDPRSTSLLDTMEVCNLIMQGRTDSYTHQPWRRY